MQPKGKDIRWSSITIVHEIIFIAFYQLVPLKLVIVAICWPVSLNSKILKIPEITEVHAQAKYFINNIFRAAFLFQQANLLTVRDFKCEHKNKRLNDAKLSHATREFM